MDHPVDVIFWDIGNVFLYPIHPPLLDRLYADGGAVTPRRDFDAATRALLTQSFLGDISLEETWRGLGLIAGLDDDAIASARRTLRVDRNERLVHAVVSELARQYRIGVISDLSQIGYDVVRTLFRDLLSVCAPELVHVSVVTRQTKIAGAREYFRRILTASGVVPRRALFVDDTPENLAAAEAEGMQVFLYPGAEAEGAWETANECLMTYLGSVPSRPRAAGLVQ